MVLIVHLFQYVTISPPPPPQLSLIFSLTRYGDRGVPIFFCLSGFLIMYSLDSKSTSVTAFYLKRFFRIVPLYYTIVTVLVYFYPMPIDELGLGWLRYYFFMNEIIPAEHQEWVSICGFWCIPSFIIFYLIAPIIHKYAGHFKFMGILVIFSYLIGKLLTVLLADYYYINPVRSFINTMPIFFYGCFCYSANKCNKQSIFLLISTCILIISATLNFSNYQVWGIATAAVIVILRDMQLPRKIRESNFLFYFSKLSFTIFLSHYIVLLYLNTLDLSAYIYILLFVFITGIIAFVLFSTVEKWSDITLKRIMCLLYKK